MNKIIIWIVVAVIIIGGFLLFGGKKSAPEETISPLILTDGNAVNAASQPAGSSVVVSLVVLKDPGYVVIHEDAKGAPGTVIGNSKLLEGENRNITVELTRASRDNETLYAMLHMDDGDGVYEFPGDDGPIKSDEGNIILMKFVIGEEAEPMAREISVSGDQFFFSPSSVSLKAGEKVKLTFRNVGSIVHNWKIEGLNIGTKTIGGGQTDTIEFTVPATGNYTIFCSVPGHRQAGMVGILTSE